MATWKASAVGILLSAFMLLPKVCTAGQLIWGENVGPVFGKIFKTDSPRGLEIRSAPSSGKVLWFRKKGGTIRGLGEFSNGWMRMYPGKGWARVAYLKPVPFQGKATGVDSTKGCLTIRKGPGKEFKEVGCARKGEVLNFTGVVTQNKWLQLREQKGWVPALHIGIRLPAKSKARLAKASQRTGQPQSGTQEQRGISPPQEDIIVGGGIGLPPGGFVRPRPPRNQPPPQDGGTPPSPDQGNGRDSPPVTNFPPVLPTPDDEGADEGNGSALPGNGSGQPVTNYPPVIPLPDEGGADFGNGSASPGNGQEGSGNGSNGSGNGTDGGNGVLQPVIGPGDEGNGEAPPTDGDMPASVETRPGTFCRGDACVKLAGNGRDNYFQVDGDEINWNECMLNAGCSTAWADAVIDRMNDNPGSAGVVLIGWYGEIRINPDGSIEVYHQGELVRTVDCSNASGGVDAECLGNLVNEEGENYMESTESLDSQTAGGGNVPATLGGGDQGGTGTLAPPSEIPTSDDAETVAGGTSDTGEDSGWMTIQPVGRGRAADSGGSSGPPESSGSNQGNDSGWYTIQPVGPQGPSFTSGGTGDKGGGSTPGTDFGGGGSKSPPVVGGGGSQPPGSTPGYTLGQPVSGGSSSSSTSSSSSSSSSGRSSWDPSGQTSSGVSFNESSGSSVSSRVQTGGTSSSGSSGSKGGSSSASISTGSSLGSRGAAIKGSTSGFSGGKRFRRRGRGK